MTSHSVSTPQCRCQTASPLSKTSDICISDTPPSSMPIFRELPNSSRVLFRLGASLVSPATSPTTAQFSGTWPSDVICHGAMWEYVKASVLRLLEQREARKRIDRIWEGRIEEGKGGKCQVLMACRPEWLNVQCKVCLIPVSDTNGSLATTDEVDDRQIARRILRVLSKTRNKYIWRMFRRGCRR